MSEQDECPGQPGAASLRCLDSSRPQKDGFPFFRLFRPDHTSYAQFPEALKSIRDRIYSFVWVPRRKEPNQGDFFINDKGVHRNVKRRSTISAFGLDLDHGVSLHHSDASLLFTCKTISDDFARYIYGVSTIEIQAKVFLYASEADYMVAREGVLDWEWAFGWEIETDKRLFSRYSKKITSSSISSACLRLSLLLLSVKSIPRLPILRISERSLTLGTLKTERRVFALSLTLPRRRFRISKSRPPHFLSTHCDLRTGSFFAVEETTTGESRSAFILGSWRYVMNCFGMRFGRIISGRCLRGFPI